MRATVVTGFSAGISTTVPGCVNRLPTPAAEATPTTSTRPPTATMPATYLAVRTRKTDLFMGARRNCRGSKQSISFFSPTLSVSSFLSPPFLTVLFTLPFLLCCEVAPVNPAILVERCKLLQWGLGMSPGRSRNLGILSR